MRFGVSARSLHVVKAASGDFASSTARPNRAGDKLRWEVWLGRYDSKNVTESTSVDLSGDGNLTSRSRTNDRLIERCSNALGLERAA